MFCLYLQTKQFLNGSSATEYYTVFKHRVVTTCVTFINNPDFHKKDDKSSNFFCQRNNIHIC